MTMMTLAEAIREGARRRPQGFGVFWDGKATCALGAAADACGFQTKSKSGSMRLSERYGALYEKQIVPCPEGPTCAVCASCLGLMIAHLNDDHRLTREAIADWVEALESQERRAA